MKSFNFPDKFCYNGHFAYIFYGESINSPNLPKKGEEISVNNQKFTVLDIINPDKMSSLPPFPCIVVK